MSIGERDLGMWVDIERRKKEKMSWVCCCLGCMEKVSRREIVREMGQGGRLDRVSHH